MDAADTAAASGFGPRLYVERPSITRDSITTHWEADSAPRIHANACTA